MKLGFSKVLGGEIERVCRSLDLALWVLQLPWCHLGENMSCCGLHKCCLSPLLPFSKPLSAYRHPQQHRDVSNTVTEQMPELLPQVW